MSSEPGVDPTAGSHLGSARNAVVDLLGLLAMAELVAFERTAADAALAPTLGDEMALATMAAHEHAHHELLCARLVELGADPQEAMAPFAAAVTEWHARLTPADWYESLLKAYLGDGIALDFYRDVARFVDADTAALVLEVCADMGQATFIVDRVVEATKRDPQLAGRLALWGRRLVGEAISQAQQVAARREALAALLMGGLTMDGGNAEVPLGEPPMDLAGLSRMFARLTDAHTRRMDGLGLAP